MMQLLPTEILDGVDLKDYGLGNYSNDGAIDCFLEVDIDFLWNCMT